MNRDKLETLFVLARELYAEKQADSGMIDPIPFAWATDNRDGALLVFSAWEKHGRDVAAQIKCSAYDASRLRQEATDAD